jgi:hypothetical protein
MVDEFYLNKNTSHISYGPVISHLSICPREMEHKSIQKYVHECLWQLYSNCEKVGMTQMSVK